MVEDKVLGWRSGSPAPGPTFPKLTNISPLPTRQMIVNFHRQTLRRMTSQSQRTAQHARPGDGKN